MSLTERKKVPMTDSGRSRKALICNKCILSQTKIFVDFVFGDFYFDAQNDYENNRQVFYLHENIEGWVDDGQGGKIKTILNIYENCPVAEFRDKYERKGWFLVITPSTVKKS